MNKIVGLSAFVIISGIIVLLILNATHVVNLKYLNPLATTSIILIGLAIIAMIYSFSMKNEGNVNINGTEVNTGTFVLLGAGILLCLSFILCTVNRFMDGTHIDVIDIVAWSLTALLIIGQVFIILEHQGGVYVVKPYDFSIVFMFLLCNFLLLLRNFGIEISITQRQD